ncbi:MAG: DUF2254 domain-containing protein [Pirellulales bacterium]
MKKLRSLWESLRSSLWFVPSLLVLGAVVLALSLIEIDAHIDRTNLQEQWPRLFGVGAEGSRGMLSSIASSMITVAGVVFSITIVALALASSQYTSRILRNFMRDRANQTVLGVFVGIFVYCLVVLRTIRGSDEGVFVPALAVLFAVVLALVGIGCLIFFIHHIAASIQAESIIKSAADETIDAIDRLFPDEMGETAGPGSPEPEPPLTAHVWQPIPAKRTGYIQGVDGDGLLRFAAAHNTVVRMERGIGEFVVEGTPLVFVADDKQPDENTVGTLDAVYTIGHQRTMIQDAGFGIRQIVDVALKALSPGINDTTTAVTCVDYLTAVLARLAARRTETPYRMDDGELRVIARGPTFPGLLGEAFDQIRQNAEGNVAVMLSLFQALEVIAGQTQNAQRRQALRRQANLIAEVAKRSIPAPHDCDGIESASVRFSQVLDGTYHEHLCVMEARREMGRVASI